MSEWKTIETAPKDGTFIIIIGKDIDGNFWVLPEIAHWQENLLDGNETGKHFSGWIEYCPEVKMRFCDVTHWIPIPKPPQSATEARA